MDSFLTRSWIRLIARFRSGAQSQMNPRFANRMKKLGSEGAFEVLARAKTLERSGKQIIHLELGEPDFETPMNIKQAAAKALHAGYTRYVPAKGITELRETIAESVSNTRNLTIDPEEVVVTPGAKPIIFFSILALVNPGDEVVYPNPGFPVYESMINFVGAKPVPMPLREEHDFRIDHEWLKGNITKKTKMIILNSPENPTGGVLHEEDLKAITEQVTPRDNIFVLSDEIYSRIIFDGKHESIASLPEMKERTIILDGFSKVYAMGGWRLGYGVMQRDLAEKITQLMINSNSCTCAFTQIAGVEALSGSQNEIERMIREFRRRREVIVTGLNEIPGIKCKKPSGAFFAFPNVKGIGLNSNKLGDYLLEEAGVAVLPGTAFGKYGEGYLRISFANSIEKIKKALNLISEALVRLSIKSKNQ